MTSLIILLAIFLSASHAFAQEPVWSKKYHTGSVTCLDFSGDGGKLLSGGKDAAIKLWNIEIGDTLKNYPQPQEVYSVELNSTGEWFIASLGYKQYQGFLENTQQYLNSDTIYRKLFSSIYFFYEYINWTKEKHLATIHTNNLLLLNNDKEYITIVTGPIQGSAAAIVYGGYSGFSELTNLDATVKPTTIRLSSETGDYAVFALSNDNNFFVYGGHSYQSTYVSKNVGTSYSSDKWICEIYDLKTKKLLQIPGLNTSDGGTITDVPYSKATPHNMVLKTTFTADSKKLLTANKAGSIHVRSVPDGIVIDSLGSQTSLATALATDMQGRYYFSAHEDSTLRIWTSGVHNVFKRIPLQNLVATIAVSPDSVHFATAHTDGTVALWNIDSLALKAVVDSVFTPSIDSISQNQTLCKNENAGFHVSARSNFGEGLLYQWQKGGLDITESDSVRGVTTATLLLKNIDNSDAGSYTAIVTTAKGDKAISAPMQLTVRDIPVISEQPIAKAVLPKGQALVLNVVVLDTTNAQFQWFKNGMASDSATKQQYVFKADFASAGMYSVRITNPCGSIMSDEAEIAILVTDIAEENSFKNTLLTAEPNPFKNSTTIHFSLEKPLKIKLAVTDILGREIAVLKDEVVEIGEQNVVFKNENLPDGTYFVTLSGDGLLKTIPVNIAR